MIKNIVFDMVGVLFRFDTEGYYRLHKISSADRDILNREVFRSMEWALLDRGAVREEDAADAVCSRVPSRLHSAVRDIIYRRNRTLMPVAGMEELLKELKSDGYGLYLLSNTSAAFHRFWPQVPGNQYFDDTLVSADVGLVKPDPEIYRLAFKQFGIDAETSVFIDDTPMNAEAAWFVGMKAFIFNGDTQEVRDWIKYQSPEAPSRRGAV